MSSADCAHALTILQRKGCDSERTRYGYSQNLGWGANQRGWGSRVKADTDGRAIFALSSTRGAYPPDNVTVSIREISRDEDSKNITHATLPGTTLCVATFHRVDKLALPHRWLSGPATIEYILDHIRR